MRPLILLLLSVLTMPVMALTYVPMPDRALLDQSPLVVEGRILSRWVERNAQGSLVTRYQVAVEQALKGELAADRIRLTLPGGDDGAGNLAYVPGVPTYHEGEELLLFLQPEEEGGYRPTQLVLGLFRRKVDGEGAGAWIRDLEGARIWRDRRGLRAQELVQVRDLEGFRRWILSDGEMEEAYWRMTSPEAFEEESARDPRYTLHESGGRHARWATFDWGGAEGWWITDNGISGLGSTDVVVPFFEKAVQAWNGDPGSNVHYYYEGIIPLSSAGSSQRNEVRLEDPLEQIAGTYGSYGVLGLGGWEATGYNSFDGQSYWTIVSGWVAIQDGAGSELAGNGGENLAEVMAHELGHTLGIGHSCGDNLSPSCDENPFYDDALMRAWMHSDGRGAALGEDDKAAVRALYADPGADPLLTNTTDACRWSNTTVTGLEMPGVGTFYCDAEEAIQLRDVEQAFADEVILRAPTVTLERVVVPDGKVLRILSPEG